MRVFAAVVPCAAALAACGGTERGRCPPVEPAPGGRLAVTADPDGEFRFDRNESDVVLLDADGSSRRRLTGAPGNDFTPSWAPDGRWLVFRSGRDRADPLDPNDELYAICADGSGERRLTTTPDVQERSPAVSPRGDRIAFAGESGGVLDLYVMRPDGSGRRNLTQGLECGAEYPTWSPDGRRIAFHCFQRLDNIELYVIGADGSRPLRVTRAAGEDSFPAWSPDGQWIAFGRDDGNLYLIRPDGTGRRRLTRGPAADAFPSWSPDGRRIAFTADRQVVVMDARGGRARRVTRGPAGHLTPAWQP